MTPSTNSVVEQIETWEPSPADIERFWSNVAIAGPDECWIWRKGKATTYGAFHIGGRTRWAHRVAWEMHNRAKLGTKLATHRCDNPPCVNPHHIVPGTHKSNNQEARERVCKPKPFCVDGHPYAPENTKITNKGWRRCKICYRDTARAHMAAKRAARKAAQHG